MVLLLGNFLCRCKILVAARLCLDYLSHLVLKKEILALDNYYVSQVSSQFQTTRILGSLYCRGLVGEGSERVPERGRKRFFFKREKNDVGGLNVFFN